MYNDLLFLTLSYLDHKEATKILNDIDPSLELVKKLPLNYFWVNADYSKKSSIKHVVFHNKPKNIHQFKNVCSVFVNWRMDPLTSFKFPEQIQTIKLNYRNYSILPLFSAMSLIRWPISFTHLVIDYTKSRLQSLTELLLILPKTVQKVTIENASNRLFNVDRIPENIKVVEFRIKGSVKERDCEWENFDCSLVNYKYIFTRKN